VVDYYRKQYPTSNSSIGSRSIYNGMTTAWDDGLKNITDDFKKKKMWEKTLLVWTTDNGPSLYVSPPPSSLLVWPDNECSRFPN
jgi:arylsulfatase A-like enzyme